MWLDAGTSLAVLDAALQHRRVIEVGTSGTHAMSLDASPSVAAIASTTGLELWRLEDGRCLAELDADGPPAGRSPAVFTRDGLSLVWCRAHRERLEVLVVEPQSGLVRLRADVPSGRPLEACAVHAIGQDRALLCGWGPAGRGCEVVAKLDTETGDVARLDAERAPVDRPLAAPGHLPPLGGGPRAQPPLDGPAVLAASPGGDVALAVPAGGGDLLRVHLGTGMSERWIAPQGGLLAGASFSGFGPGDEVTFLDERLALVRCDAREDVFLFDVGARDGEPRRVWLEGLLTPRPTFARRLGRRAFLTVEVLRPAPGEPEATRLLRWELAAR